LAQVTHTAAVDTVDTARVDTATVTFDTVDTGDTARVDTL
jgi:hypothetical protein